MKKLAVVTVADNGFVPGTVALIYSFSKHHPDTDYDVIVINAGLSEDNKKLLSLFNGLRLKELSEVLEKKITKLANSYSHLKNEKKVQFYSLDLFNVSGYQKLLFCDSDLMFLSSIKKELLAKESPFVACPDYCSYKGATYNPETFEMQKKSDSKSGLDNTFNAGLMYIDQSQINQEHYQRIIKFLSPAFWNKIDSHHTDQVVFNHIFKDVGDRMPIEYNYLLYWRPWLQKLTGVMPIRAKVLHFIGPKPWQLDKAQARMLEDPLIIPIYKLWMDTYTEAMQYLSIKQKIKRKMNHG